MKRNKKQNSNMHEQVIVGIGIGTSKLMRRLPSIRGCIEVEYRKKAKDETFKCFFDRGRITQYDNGTPAVLEGI